MTAPHEHRQGEQVPHPWESAEADLAQLRETLTAAAHGEAGQQAVKDSVLGYLEQHGPALRDAAAAIGEESRRQTLEALYRWRGQVRAQLQARQGAWSGSGEE
jgi:hypothetical protein